VLTYNGSVWRNLRPGLLNNYVERPAGLGAYSIVAAGIIKGDGTVRGMGYNNLRVTTVDLGNIGVTFDNYVDPTTLEYQYIIKAMAVVRSGPALVVNFREFRPKETGFILRVTSSRNGSLEDVDIDTLKQTEFMVEVSQYDFKQKDETPRI
jgi:hypothetical protein